MAAAASLGTTVRGMLIGSKSPQSGMAPLNSSMLLALALEGPEDTWEVVRAMMGATNPLKSAPGTIRGDFGTLFTENLVHGSDSLASAERELGIFFPNL